MDYPRDHLSYSAVNKYLQCPKRWHYDYVVAKDEKKESFALKLGSLYHSALEKLYITGEVAEGESMFTQFAGENGKFRQKEIEKTRMCFENYHDTIYPQYQTRVERIEVKDDVFISGLDIPLEYRIDLITTDGTLVDHKTVGRFAPDIEYSLQFDLYAYGYYQKYGVLPRSVEYHNAYKATGRVEVMKKIPRVSDMLKAVSCVAGAYRGVKEDIFIPKYSKACNYCPHREICDREFGMI